MNLIADGLILPLVILGVMGWAVPKLLARVFAEGVRPLVVLTFASVLILFGLSALLFAGLYALRGAPVDALVSADWTGAVAYFGRLGLSSGLVWAPILLLTVSTLPKHWTTEVW